MRHVFLDANVVIDYLATREPFSTQAALLFEMAEKKKLKLFTAAVSFNVIYYILRQQTGHNAAIGYLKDLSLLLFAMDVTGKEINNALSSPFADFEDAIQYFTAISNPEISAIITRDKKGFRNSSIPAMAPAEFLSSL
jgi:predicted nucleic acid-binding protein